MLPKDQNSAMENVQKVGIEKHPRKIEARIQYGTAGFRTSGDILDHVMFRMGALAVFRSKAKEGSTIGVMITASHNPEKDNGVKLVDPKGEMLEQSWESIATRLANADDSEVNLVLEDIIRSNNIPSDKSAEVFVGRDTRQSSPALCQAVIDGIQAAGGKVKDYGIVSTPQLHFFVVCQNTNGLYGEPTEDGYFKKLSQAFVKFMSLTSGGRYVPEIKFDGANGVGGQKMKQFNEHLQNLKPGVLSVEIVNDGGQPDDVLNLHCGADHVKTSQGPPRGLESTKPGERCVAVDGDADRVVYFFRDANGKFNLMDGDKIGTLVAGYFKELLSAAGSNLSLGLVQTAYANGSSTKYINETLEVPVACVSTGVKHLHHKALDYDIGVYFEANGHGTVVFSTKAENDIKTLAKSGNEAGIKLALLLDVINQTVGDAISDMFLVECILSARGWDVEQWSKAYDDLPNRLMKVRVADRNVIRTADAERKCTEPAGLQDEIDKLTSVNPTFRSFVRPSGTEDVVRVYAEADTDENARQLAYDVGLKVHQLAGGVGEPTPKPK